MKLTPFRSFGNYDKKECYVHTRACRLPDGRLFMTLQRLNVEGSDTFSALEYTLSSDEGRTYGAVRYIDGEETDEHGIRHVVCDATPIYHAKSGKVIIIGTIVKYNGLSQVDDAVRHIAYYVYDVKDNRFFGKKLLSVSEEYETGITTGSPQMVIEDDGSILIPAVKAKKERFHLTQTVIKCEFDGSELKLVACGSMLTVDVPRGLYEGSLYKHKGRYYLTMRNDDYGYCAFSDDGLNFSAPEIWRWDDNEILGNYNTQQHWCAVGDELYLVYTRRDAKNGHVFRHRAPLYIAQVDTEKMRLKRGSEKIAVEERGARLGNFGVCALDKNSALITVGEWMQPAGCEKYGSDNSVYSVKVED